MRSRMRSTRRSRNRLPARRLLSGRWSACANWCSRQLQVPLSWRRPPNRCPRCRAICWIPWISSNWRAPTKATIIPKCPAAEATRATRRRGPVAEKNHASVGRELHIVGFQVGRETYGIPIISLHEIVRVPQITAVPDAPDYMEGVINLRGKIVSVIDLRKRLGEKEFTSGNRNRILVVEYRGKLCGLIVDAASEVIKLPV